MSLISEIEDLFGTKAKGNVVCFSDYQFVPIPRPIVEAVKAIASDYPDQGVQIGLYSVKVLDQNIRHVNIQSAAKRVIESATAMGNLHDKYVTGEITEKETIDKLVKENGYNRAEAKYILKKWGPVAVKQNFKRSF